MALSSYCFLDMCEDCRSEYCDCDCHLDDEFWDEEAW